MTRNTTCLIAIAGIFGAFLLASYVTELIQKIRKLRKHAKMYQNEVGKPAATDWLKIIFWPILDFRELMRNRIWR